MPRRADLERMMPRLRQDVEASRRLAERAIERASRLADEAMATRRFLENRTRDAEALTTRDTQIWTAAAHEVERASRERDRQLGVVAHELRQPLAAAIAAERLLAVHPSGEARERARGVLSRQLEHLSSLTESLLLYSRLAIYSAPAGHAPVDLVAVAASAVEAVAPAASARQQDLRFEPAVAQASVAGDRTRLRQALLNLLHNAVRYTPPGGLIGVRIYCREDRVHVDVHDTGGGIAADRLDAVFDPFVRLSSGGSGLGIGLTLVRKIVELHGGTVTASSDGEGRGSVFTIALPLSTTDKDDADAV